MEDKIRTLGLYQPYASLMLHGKIESRWVQRGKKPPFPLGKYLIYSTKKCYQPHEFKHVAGEFHTNAQKLLHEESTAKLNGFALCIGDLMAVEKIGAGELSKAFFDVNLTMLKDVDPEIDLWNELIVDDMQLWGLRFQNIQRIKPFQFKGKQGVGFLSEEDKANIEYA